MRRFGSAALAVAGTLLAAAGPARAQGEALYTRYCASCHGISGAGDGPAAESLSPPPSDLRKLEAEVPALMQAVDGRRTIRAHGSATMPVWGRVLEDAKAGEPHAGRTTLHEVQALAEHVRSLREKR